MNKFVHMMQACVYVIATICEIHMSAINTYSMILVLTPCSIIIIIIR